MTAELFLKKYSAYADWRMVEFLKIYDNMIDGYNAILNKTDKRLEEFPFKTFGLHNDEMMAKIFNVLSSKDLRSEIGLIAIKEAFSIQDIKLCSELKDRLSDIYKAKKSKFMTADASEASKIQSEINNVKTLLNALKIVSDFESDERKNLDGMLTNARLAKHLIGKIRSYGKLTVR